MKAEKKVREAKEEEQMEDDDAMRKLEAIISATQEISARLRRRENIDEQNEQIEQIEQTGRSD